MTGEEWIEIARQRLINILRNHGVARMRTLEQKISAAGPYSQRANPHILTKALDELLSEKIVVRLQRSTGNWFHLPETNLQKINDRLGEQEPILKKLNQENTHKRLGQALEIAVFRSLSTQPLPSFGHYYDLEEHMDNELYRKEEPPSAVSGRAIPNDRKLDFLIISGESGPVGIEVKNRREWIYPRHKILRDLLEKCCYLDAIPVLIARRIQYSTITVFQSCGLLIHETYNQRYPETEFELAQKAKDRTLLGYSDILLGNIPNQRLQRFIHETLPESLPKRRRRFDEFQDLLWKYAIEGMSYEEFARRVRRRRSGLPEPEDDEFPAF